MDLKLIIGMIGTLILGAILYSIPILMTCGLVFHWNGSVNATLLILALFEYIGLVIKIAIDTVKEEDY